MNQLHSLPSWLSEPLLEWYDSSHRILPWRSDPTPYRVWISEIMLQQTRVEVVKNYFLRFMEEFPSIESLAKAEEEKLLKMWEGLGYYSRARNLLIAARQIVDQFQGEMPSSKEELITLKGIGNYTAGAISAFAFNRDEVAVDGNVLRVVARLMSSESDILLESTKRQTEQELKRILPKNRAGDFGQAMIELGAVVCIPGVPKCHECPLRGICLGRMMGKEAELPVRNNRTKKKEEERTVFLIQHKDRYLIEKRSSTGLLAGLYQFPNTLGHLSKQEAIAYFENNYHLRVVSCQVISPSKHSFSHLVWNMIGYLIQVEEDMSGDFLWADIASLKDSIALPSAFQRYNPLYNEMIADCL